MTYNTAGHICPKTQRVAMTVADAYADQDGASLWRYSTEMATDPWRQVDWIDWVGEDWYQIVYPHGSSNVPGSQIIYVRHPA